MKLLVKNIGIVKNGEIAIDGLTVITGKNSSGKTTLGKVIYSVFRAGKNLEKAYENEKYDYAMSQLTEARRAFRFPTSTFNEKKINKCSKAQYNILVFICQGFHSFETEELIHFIHDLKDNLQSFTVEEFKNIEKEFFRLPEDFRSVFYNRLIGFEDSKKIAIDLLEETIQTLDNDSFESFVRSRFHKYLLKEFNGQIQPIKSRKAETQIIVTNEDKEIVHCTLTNKEMKQFGYYPFSNSINTIFIDNPFVIDNLYKKKSSNEYYFYRHLINLSDISSHNDELIDLLGAKQTENYFDNLSFQNKYKEIVNRINEIVPGEFVVTKDGFFYINDSAKLDVRNLATGSKMFSIIKLLLMNGSLTKDTILILDEPESHLHPEWINRFAEIMVLLVKEVGIKVILTTHSPNLLLAFDVYSKENDISELSHYYIAQEMSEPSKKGFSEIKCIDGNISEGYAHLSVPLLELSVQKNEVNGDK